MRESKLKRETQETKIEIALNLDGTGESRIKTGIGFFDHMLTLLSFHSGIDLNVSCKGDLHVDGHHSVEDIGILLGKAIREALGDKKGISRYGNCYLPMDEALVHSCLDISGRAFLVFHVSLPRDRVGDFDTELTEEFFRAVAMNSGITLHLNLVYGQNTHHIIEAVFKGFAKSLKQAISLEEENQGRILSSKGVI